MPEALAQVAPGVHRLGSPLVNFYLVEEARRYTLIDAGLPGFFDQVPAALAALGADLHDLDAVILTHAHADTIGIAERLRTEAQAKVFVHGADAQVARSGHSSQSEGSILPDLWRPSALRLIAHYTRNGGARANRLEDVTTFADGAVLEVPGHPTVIGTPGHSHGHSSLLLRERGVLFTGDALCSRNLLTGRVGPQLMSTAFNASTEKALASLDRLESVDAPTLLFGHGEPWTRGAAEAVRRARRLGPS